MYQGAKSAADVHSPEGAKLFTRVDQIEAMLKELQAMLQRIEHAGLRLAGARAVVGAGQALPHPPRAGSDPAPNAISLEDRLFTIIQLLDEQTRTASRIAEHLDQSL